MTLVLYLDVKKTYFILSKKLLQMSSELLDAKTTHQLLTADRTHFAVVDEYREVTGTEHS